jgi:hypothetical protein
VERSTNGEGLQRAADGPWDVLQRIRLADHSVRFVVNGEEVSEALFERTVVYFFGSAYIERKIRDLLIAKEIAGRAETDRYAEDIQVSSAEVLREVESTKNQMRQQVQGETTIDAVLRVQGLDQDSLVEEKVSELRFDKVFFPEDPTKWPPSTRQALFCQGGSSLVDRVERGLKESREKKPTERIRRLYKSSLRRLVFLGLKKASKILMASDGLPPEVILSVDDRKLLTAESYADVARMVSPIDRERVLRWIVLVTATRQALTRAGTLISHEAMAKEFRTDEGQSPDGVLTMEIVARGLKGFPCYDLYLEYYRLRKSFERMIEKEVTDEALVGHSNRIQEFLGDGKVDAEVILCTAVDYTDFSWRGADAFDRARIRSEEVAAKLKEGAPFEELIDRFSEFFDAPVFPSRQQTAGGPRPNRGRFGPQSKSRLKQLLGESEFDELVRGYSIGDLLFYDAPVGEVVGPIRGPLGYYLGRVIARHAGGRPVDLTQPNQRDHVREDYVARRFLEWSSNAVAKSRVEIR